MGNSSAQQSASHCSLRPRLSLYSVVRSRSIVEAAEIGRHEPDSAKHSLSKKRGASKGLRIPRPSASFAKNGIPGEKPLFRSLVTPLRDCLASRHDDDPALFAGR